jgi:ribonuclease BN (tRNA processing enzyme)
MGSRVIFLGTAGSTAVVSKHARSAGGIVIQVDELQFHLDPGPGAMVKAKEHGVNVQHTTAILVSHNHINHCNDLNAIVEAMTYGGLEQRGIILGSKSVLQATNQSYPFLTAYHQAQVERIIPLEKNHKVGVEMVEIHALPVEHTDTSAVGFKLYCPKFIVSYTGDTRYSEELVASLQGTDFLILNVPYPGNKSAGMNLDTVSATKIINQVRPKIAVLTHFGLEMLKADPILEAREVQRITGVQTIAAQEGLAIAAEGMGGLRSPVKGF